MSAVGRKEEAVWTVLAQGFTVLQAVVQTKILTNALTLDQYGEWALVLSLTALVTMLPFSAFNEAHLRAIPLITGRDSARFIASASFIYGICIAAWAVIWAVSTLLGLPPVRSEFLLPFLAFTFSEILKTTAFVAYNARRKRRIVAIGRGVDLLLRVLLILTTYKWFGSLTPVVVMSTFAVGNLLMLGAILPRVVRSAVEFSIRDSREQLSGVLKFSWPLLTWAIFGWLQTMVNRWYLAALLEPTAVAAFAVLITLTFFVPNFVYTIFAMYRMPIAFSKDAPVVNLSEQFRLLFRLTLLLSPYLLGVVFFSEVLIITLTSSRYLFIASCIPWLTVTSCCQVIAAASTIELYRRNQTRKLLIANLLPGGFTVLSGYPMIQLWGFNGAVISAGIAQMLYALVILFVTTRTIHRNSHKGDDDEA